jgi:glycosyltransferase involved in cell wall biosynthesis
MQRNPKLKKKLKCKLIYDSHELWTESSFFSIPPKIISIPLKKIISFFEKKMIKSSDINITVNNSIAIYLSKKYNIIKPRVIKNVPKITSYNNDEKLLKKEFNLTDEKKIIIYQGYLSLNRGIENLLSSVEFINSKIVLIFMGYGPLLGKIKKYIFEKKLTERVFIKGAVSPEKILKFTSGADLGISLFHNTCLSHFFVSPNKVWEYILSGVPIIVSDLPEMKKLAVDEGMGLLVDHTSPIDIANKINYILDEKNIEFYNKYKENCISKGKNRYNWNIEKIQFLEIYQNII